MFDRPPATGSKLARVTAMTDDPAARELFDAFMIDGRVDSNRRVWVRPAKALASRSRTWERTVDFDTGVAIEMRAADCGASCYCATEVRLFGSTR